MTGRDVTCGTRLVIEDVAEMAAVVSGGINEVNDVVWGSRNGAAARLGRRRRARKSRAHIESRGVDDDDDDDEAISSRDSRARASNEPLAASSVPRDGGSRSSRHSSKCPTDRPTSNERSLSRPRLRDLVDLLMCV